MQFGGAVVAARTSASACKRPKQESCLRSLPSPEAEVRRTSITISMRLAKALKLALNPQIDLRTSITISMRLAVTLAPRKPTTLRSRHMRSSSTSARKLACMRRQRQGHNLGSRSRVCVCTAHTCHRGEQDAACVQQRPPLGMPLPLWGLRLGSNPRVVSSSRRATTLHPPHSGRPCRAPGPTL
jgi:hypothetical protein